MRKGVIIGNPCRLDLALGGHPPECLKINFEFVLTRSTAEEVGGFVLHQVFGSCFVF